MKSLDETLRNTNSLLYVACAGAGTPFIADLFSVPGCSSYMAGARVLYAPEDLHDFIGHQDIEHAVSYTTALELATESYIRARQTNRSKNAVGLGVTAAIATNRQRKGEHQAFYAVVTHDHIIVDYKWLGHGSVEGEDSRKGMELFITQDCVAFLQYAVLNPDPEVETKLARETFFKHPVFGSSGVRQPGDQGSTNLVFPSAFNPLHDGHRTICETAENLVGFENATYLVCTKSPHKGEMPLQQMLDIVAQVRNEKWRADYRPRTVEFSADEPLFIDMARKRPGSTFIIGADAMQRMLDPKWGPNVEEMLNEMRNLKVTFLVRGREIEGKFVQCRDIAVPFPYQLLFRPLEGRCDISSTDLRKTAT
jgi:nicotinic acid mononucleotide adenylyltransferase/nicotinamide mononucleotide (NMN) deamidase PncC